MRVLALGFRVQGLGFRVQGLGFRVLGSLRVQEPEVVGSLIGVILGVYTDNAK